MKIFFNLCILTLIIVASVKIHGSRILYLPLDERFTTRNAFLNLATLTPYTVITPEPDVLPSLKRAANLPVIDDWLASNIATADALVLSAEMFLYGGLIASRISNDTTEAVRSRLNTLFEYADKYPSLKIYISNVVMRIPSYDGDFEEPWYWANYGDELFTYSFYMDKYNQLNCSEDLDTAQSAIESVPKSAVEEFTWRRERNHNITMETLRRLKLRRSFQYYYTTLDDSAEYGYNIREAQAIKDFINGSQGLDFNYCPVYPGADEVHLVMLARYAVNDVFNGKSVALETVYRDGSNIDAIPSYEGQPMSLTLSQQAAASGAVLRSGDVGVGDAVLLVNNFSGDQEEAYNQPTSTNATTDYSMFDAYIKGSLGHRAIGFCDNRYANGADALFVQYLTNQVSPDGLRSVAYAGWNTNGNTVGTVIANTVLLFLFGESAGTNNALFNSLRLLEDMHYQADQRQVLRSYISTITNTEENSSNLAPDLDFYRRFSFKVLASKYEGIAQQFSLSASLDSLYFPWNRTFEIGFYLTAAVPVK